MRLDTYKNRYKCRRPEEVIKTCTETLERLGYIIEILEQPAGVGGMHSVHVVLKTKDDVLIAYTNGKGADRNLAMASGLAETVERIFTQLNPKSIMRRDFLYNIDIPFLYDFRERYVDLEEIVLNPNEVISKFSGEDPYLFSFLAKSYKKDGKIVCVEYNNVDESKDSILLPFEVMRGLNGSNGYCAGSTKEEALVQGISELLERYIQLLMIEEDRNMLDSIGVIDKNSICVTDSVRKTISDIESKGNYIVTILDLTMNGKYPVAGLLLVDKTKQIAKLNIGAFPDYRIAIERCFTEILQNSTLDTWNGHPISTEINKNSNKEALVTNGYGRYAYEIFGIDRVSKENKYTQLLNINENSNNITFLEELKEIISRDNTSVYYYDCSFTENFHVYIVVSPLYSYVFKSEIRELEFKDIEEEYTVDFRNISNEKLIQMFNSHIEYLTDSGVRMLYLLEPGCKLFGKTVLDQDTAYASQYVLAILALKLNLVDLAETFFSKVEFNEEMFDLVYLERLRTIIKLKKLGLYDILEKLIDDKSFLDMNKPVTELLRTWGVEVYDDNHKDLLKTLRRNLLLSQAEFTNH